MEAIRRSRSPCKAQSVNPNAKTSFDRPKLTLLGTDSGLAAVSSAFCLELALVTLLCKILIGLEKQPHHNTARIKWSDRQGNKLEETWMQYCKSYLYWALGGFA